MCASGDLNYIQGVKMSIDDILLVTKDKYPEHIQQLRINLNRRHNNGLKLNALKCIFGLKEIPYL